MSSINLLPISEDLIDDTQWKMTVEKYRRKIDDLTDKMHADEAYEEALDEYDKFKKSSPGDLVGSGQSFTIKWNTGGIIGTDGEFLVGNKGPERFIPLT